MVDAYRFKFGDIGICVVDDILNIGWVAVNRIAPAVNLVKQQQVAYILKIFVCWLWRRIVVISCGYRLAKQLVLFLLQLQKFGVMGVNLLGIFAVQLENVIDFVW